MLKVKVLSRSDGSVHEALLSPVEESQDLLVAKNIVGIS